MTTRQFNAQFHCSNCKTWQTQETMFGRWIRNNKKLDSSLGYCVTDQDYWIHKYKTHGRRDFQLIMLVEIKTLGQTLTEEQRDTLFTVNQLMRNRKQTPTKKLLYQAGRGISKVRSSYIGKIVCVKAFGMHALLFSGLGPDDSESIVWDNREINSDTLTELLAFNLDPDTLNPIDLRNHHSKNNLTLFKDEAIGE